MSQQKLSLYALSGVVRDEVFLESQLAVAGSNQSRILENLQRNKNSIKRQSAVLKIVYAFLIGFISIMPIMAFFQMKEMLSKGLVPGDTILLVFIIFQIITSGMTFLYMLVLGMLSLSGLLSGDVFQMLEVLPIPRKNIQRIGVIVLWRFFDIPLIVQMVVYPILMLVVTGNGFVLLFCVATSFLNTIFIFFILVLITEKFSRIIKGGAINSRKVTIIRTLTMLGYVIVVLSASLILNLVLQNISAIVDVAIAVLNPGNLNLILSLIPFPFATAYLLSMVLIPTTLIPLPLIGSTLIGILILCILTWKLYHLVLNKIRNITSFQARVAPLADQKRPSQIKIRPITPVIPVKAFIRKDLAALTRDLQGMMYVLMPLVFPFIFFLEIAGSMGDLERTSSPTALYGTLLGLLIMLTVMNAGMLVSGILGIEDSGASIMASLPVLPRDQVKAKMRIIGIVNLISLLLPIVVLAGTVNITVSIPFFLSYCPIGMTVAFLMLAMKARLFGKMRYKYVIEEVNVERKVMKWVAIIGLNSGLLLGLLFLVFSIGETLGSIGILGMLAVIGVGGLVLVLWWLNRMFPAKKSKPSLEVTY